MGIYEVMRRFPDKESCMEFLEEIRWKHGAYCPHCGSIDVNKKNKRSLSRWNCFDCRSSFNVLSGTMFNRTRIPLQKWFLEICIMMNAKKGISSYQLARDLEINQKAAWYMMIRIRREMEEEENHLLSGIVEIDETYIGGRPRRHGQRKAKRGRGTNRIPVIGAVERGGNITARVQTDLSGRGILQ